MAASSARAAASTTWRASSTTRGSGPSSRTFSRGAVRLMPTSTVPLLRRAKMAPPVASACNAGAPWTPSRPSSTSSSSFATNPRFSYNIAASFIAKDRPYDPSTHVFHFNPYNRIQPPRQRRRSSRPDSGHDAFFVSRVNDSGAVAFGVADGVGGWTDSGVDPADFSHGFCDYMAAVAYEHDGAESPPLTARRLMQGGYDAVCNDKSLHAGGSTACVAIAAPDGTLDVANLGDSGFLHLRLNGVNAYSEPQTHAFNTPFQLSLIPPRLAARMAAFGGTQLSDLPRDADVTQHYLRHGDVLIFATDGVLDNLFNQDILRIASRVMVSSGAWQMTEAGGVRCADSIDALTRARARAGGDRGSPGEATTTTTTTTTTPERTVTLQSLLATELVGAAKSASVNTKIDGPFAKEVQKYYPHEQWRGGKVDDICVVVAVVSEDSAGAKSKL
ncbi:Protein-serine/threonine phosphatase [Purpureocillium takamizusanense]|uniref:Protein phosphatase n=1 Tax=Purpureocillium takamizusanense TaxID=2060973 RepID=A0A9Q8QRA1_9HYPO|nr:Protein-serine/threonine phosphatase [Purpureocillium takamizusanense]UNI25078.1 Protein-serine/threonine phosphatase [Purpureocillium takamizusanense]